jgi:hypothetical protein
MLPAGWDPGKLHDFFPVLYSGFGWQARALQLSELHALLEVEKSTSTRLIERWFNKV